MKSIAILITVMLFSSFSTADDSIAPGAKVKKTPADLKHATFSILDSDQDGVMRDQDQCLATPFGAKVDENGCAICPIESLRDNEGCYAEDVSVIHIPIEVNFDTDSDIVKSQYYSSIQDIAKAILEYNVERIEIAGHTDSQGPETHNASLSQRRAQSVADMLQKFGIPSNKIVAKGYGESAPIASNDTADGRLMNRRVTAVVSVEKNTKRYVSKK